ALADGPGARRALRGGAGGRAVVGGPGGAARARLRGAVRVVPGGGRPLGAGRPRCGTWTAHRGGRSRPTHLVRPGGGPRGGAAGERRGRGTGKDDGGGPADRPGASGPRPGGRGDDQWADRRAAVHQSEDGLGARLGDPAEVGRGEPDRGRAAGEPVRAGRCRLTDGRSRAHGAGLGPLRPPDVRRPGHRVVTGPSCGGLRRRRVVRGQDAASVVRLRVLVASSGMPGPIVVLMVALVMYRPFELDGLSRRISSWTAA